MSGPHFESTLRLIGRSWSLVLLTAIATASSVADAQSTPQRLRAGVHLVESPMITGVDTMSAKFAVDTGTIVVAPKVPCGPRRACPAGWDLRVVSVKAPATRLPAGGFVPATLEVENRGRAAAPATEFKACLVERFGGCERAFNGTIPALASGAVARTTVMLNVPREHIEEAEIVAVIDPDRVTGDTKSENNKGRSSTVGVELPAFEWVAIDVDERVPLGAPVRVSLTLRNVSYATTVPSTEIEVRPTEYSWRDDALGEGPAFRVALPPVGPRQTIAVTVNLQLDPAKLRNVRDDDFEVWLQLDPEDMVVWRQDTDRDGDVRHVRVR